ncbi:MAG: hypothetical protein WCO93_11800 [bacterium]
MKAIRNIHSVLAPALLVIVIALAGCNSAPDNKEANQQAADTIKKEVTLSPEAQNLLYQFPTPFEVTMMLEKAKAGFIFDITNPPSNIGKYVTENSKAINLGVYSADLSYSATYNRIDESNKFLACTSRLADELGIAGVYDKNLPDKIKKFNNNKDSLVNMISKVFSATNAFLSSNNRNEIAVLIACGTYSEGLYLASSLNVVAKDNTLISAVIFKQKESLDKLLTILEAYQSDENMKKIGLEIAKLRPIFTDYGLDSGKKIPMQKAADIADLAESVRNSFVR